MTKLKAIYYGRVEVIPGVVCDGYILDDYENTAVMSERGTADLLGIRQYTLQSMTKNWPPKSLEPFIDKELSMTKNCVEVVAHNSPYRGRKIVVYTAAMIETLISAYALALAHRELRQNQRHIGERCVILLKALVRTALNATIQEACGFLPEIQKTAQKHYVDAVELIQDSGFICSLPNSIATKQDIAGFLKIPESTLNSFLYKHRDEIKPTRLDTATIRSIGRKANRMNGYQIEEVAKIVLGMDTEVGIDLKKRIFGQLGTLANFQTRDEIQWRKVLAKVFKGFDLRYNYPIGKYRVDFYVAKMGLVLECNGFSHRYYNPEEEAAREKAITEKYALVRFQPNVNLETLVNGILQSKAGSVIRLYDLKDICRESSVDLN